MAISKYQLNLNKNAMDINLAWRGNELAKQRREREETKKQMGCQMRRNHLWLSAGYARTRILTRILPRIIGLLCALWPRCTRFSFLAPFRNRIRFGIGAYPATLAASFAIRLYAEINVHNLST